MRAAKYTAILFVIGGAVAAALCEDCAADCQLLVSVHGCDDCCMEYGQTIRTCCRKSCDFCTPPTSGDSYAMQQSALAALYHNTDGDDWVNNTNWLDSNVSHCLWFGVNCDSAGNVSILQLESNFLTGK